MQLSIGPPQSIEHRGLAYCYTAYIYICSTATPTARSRTMHIYRRQMDPPAILA